MLLDGLPALAVAGSIITALVGYILVKCIYDLFFHPLRNFPGPKVAAIGSFYEFYYDVIKDGTYLWEIEKMHQKYGPIIRINSNSIHIRDPEYYSTVYAGGGRKINKELSTVAGYTFPHSALATIDHDLHRRRKAIISPYFSQRAAIEIEPLIHERLDALCSHLEKKMASGDTVNITCAASAFTADVVMQHFYGYHLNFVGAKDFKYYMREGLTGLFEFYHATRFMPFPPVLIKKLPSWILRRLNKNLPLIIEGRNDHKKMILSYLNCSGNAEKQKDGSRAKSVIVSALTDPNVPEQEKTLDRLLDEGETIIFAGMDTSARGISAAMFYMHRNKELLQRLQRELESLSKPANQWTTAELKGLPYMEAVVQEALRFQYGLVVRVPRISAQEALQYKGYTIPPGTPVSISSYLTHHDESVFPNSHVFDPERWIKAAKEGINLDKYMVSFTKGSRICIGINIAYAQMYLCIARLVSHLEMELFDTTLEDMQVYHARGLAYPKKGSGTVKMKIIGVRKTKRSI
ncbi:hypothetical protein MauCBS54593_006774 [Microsporum audouinii]